MDENLVRRIIVDGMRRHSQSLDEAARALKEGMQSPIVASVVDRITSELRERSRSFSILDDPSGVHSLGYESLAAEARDNNWYIGPQDGDKYWPKYRSLLEKEGADYLEDLDRSSNKVVAHLADPNVGSLRKKGLVLGYVQSGKTANYTAVIAKAVDAGYRLVVVLSGLHNNLRRQTQIRLENDLLQSDWLHLTTKDEDFGRVVGGEALLAARGVPIIAVTKKNGSRLRKLRDWLRDMSEVSRRKCPILIIDDEADQATPNSARNGADRTAINKLVREIWDATITGSYVGYTATPYANVFMDPTDAADLYPSDFIIDLKRSENYFGAAQIFGRDELDENDNPDDGLDMIRLIRQEEADSLRPPSQRDGRDDFDPELPVSLRTAVRWFLISTAVRRARGQNTHSSMLIHTTHYTQPHFAMRDRVRGFLNDLNTTDIEFETLYRDEIGRVEGVTAARTVPWVEVRAELEKVLDSAKVVVDNGSSLERVVYDMDDEQGESLPKTLIAIGGATLSRGLTLEGLVVSYFVRSSSTYDTLLQMGRWFGYRPGYEDLPRIWTTSDLANDFRFLSGVEEEIRRDITAMERAKITPQQMGVKVRAHPGRLEITAKMGVAERVRLSYSDTNKQTFILEETNLSVLENNLAVTRDLIAQVGFDRFEELPRSKSRRIARGVPATAIADYFERYSFHESQPSLKSGLLSGWIRKAAPDSIWNVVVMGASHPESEAERSSVALGFNGQTPMFNRAPLYDAPIGTANIKALVSRPDWLVDLDPDAVMRCRDSGVTDPGAIRSSLDTSSGLLMIYPVDPRSVPQGASLRTGRPTRRSMEGAAPMIGLGIFFPKVQFEQDTYDAEYYSVSEISMDLPEDLVVPVDSEDSNVVNAEDMIGDHK